jgi:hypothetical protein
MPGSIPPVLQQAVRLAEWMAGSSPAMTGQGGDFGFVSADGSIPHACAGGHPLAPRQVDTPTDSRFRGNDEETGTARLKRAGM